MKIESWTFVVRKAAEQNVRRQMVHALFENLGSCIRDSNGACTVRIDDRARTLSLQSQEEILPLLSQTNTCGIDIHLSPEGWPFYVWFLPEDAAAKSLQPHADSGTVWFEIKASTDAILRDASAEERAASEISLGFLAETVIKSTQPIWGVRLHEWDAEYVMQVDDTLLDYGLELRHGRIPRRLGPITYLNNDLLSRAPLERVAHLQIARVDNFGSLISVSNQKWPETLIAWSKGLEESLM